MQFAPTFFSFFLLPRQMATLQILTLDTKCLYNLINKSKKVDVLIGYMRAL